MAPTLDHQSLIHQAKSFSLQLCLEMQISCLKYITPTEVLITAQSQCREKISSGLFPFASLILNRCRWRKSEPGQRRLSMIQSTHLSATRITIDNSRSFLQWQEWHSVLRQHSFQFFPCVELKSTSCIFLWLVDSSQMPHFLLPSKTDPILLHYG